MPITDNEKEVILSLDGHTSVTILKYGATVLSWRVHGKEQLWLSEKAVLDGSKAVRGGIPLVFPVFGKSAAPHATAQLSQHGFVRSHEWELLGQTNDCPLTVQFGLGPENLSEQARVQWNYDFTLIYTVSLTKDRLVTALTVENTDSKPFEFNVLFHTYLRIPEISHIKVEGLHGLQVVDKVKKSSYVEAEAGVSIAGEVARVYENSRDPVTVVYQNKSLFSVEDRHNIPDVVVWNPWKQRAQELDDFYPKDGFHQMICVETGLVSKFATLDPNQKWQGSQTIKVHL